MVVSVTGAGIEPRRALQENTMTTTNNANQNLIVTAFWEVNPGRKPRSRRF